MLFAMTITPKNIDEITELNAGVRPAKKTMNDHTFFVYSDISDPDFHNEILARSDFEKTYRYLDRSSNDNAVAKK